MGEPVTIERKAVKDANIKFFMQLSVVEASAWQGRISQTAEKMKE